MTKENKLSVRLNGSLTNRCSKRKLDNLLFAINDYIGLKDQLKTQEMGAASTYE
ncbi:hypothetical protein FJQ98_16165 [Lysinibacillus agricola]|uniref:Uncharacterized protein n=1 Tax=Lysinibacillus agricola TaxID=2590012 RepID=A0ABX7AMR1_9BACI|nr:MULTISPECIES: hypothetical protein [Lysinibacillus]QQP10781.1 hypothetical protein FJQ98_16165 [Lysinibacillus agricola]